MKNVKPRLELEYNNVYFLDKRTNEIKSKFDIISRDLRYIPRASDRSKALSKAARALLSNYHDMISKSDNKMIFVDSEFISGITEVGVRQNNNLHKELSEIFNIKYHHVVRINGRKCRDGFTIEFTENTKNILESPKSFYANGSNTDIDPTVKSFKHYGKKFPQLQQTIATPLSIEELKKNIDRSTEPRKIFSVEKKSTGSNFQEKSLKEFHPLTEEDHQNLQTTSKRDFTLNAMNEILLDMSNRFIAHPERVAPSFKSKKGFMDYFSKCLHYEKRQVVKTSNENFRIRNNMTAEEKQEVEVEKYLEGVENSQQVSPESHLKKKLACVLEKHKAYALLKAYASLAIVAGIAKIQLRTAVDLTPHDHEVILSQIRATHERFDGDEYVSIKKLEFVVREPLRSKLRVVSNGAEIPSTPWGEMRRRLIDIYGQDVDRNWFAHLEGTVNENTKTLEIKAPNDFFRKYIQNDFFHRIENIAGQMGLAVSDVTF